MFIRALAAGALAAGLLLGTPATSHAAKPDEQFKFQDQFTEVDEFLSAVCGFEITFTLDTRGTFRSWDDGRVHVTEHGSFVLANPENGTSLTNEWTGNYRGQGTETFGDDGTLSIEFRDVNTGIPERWRDGNRKTLIFDRGRAVFEGEIVIDLETDELLDFHETVTTNGPHPTLGGGGLDPSLACGFLS